MKSKRYKDYCECTQIKKFRMMYNTYLYDQNQWSILSLFHTDKNKARWYRQRDRQPQGVK